MKTITSVQFLAQSEKVQKVLKNYITFEEGDYFYNTKEETQYTYEDFYKGEYSLARPTWEGEYFSNLDDFVPLLQMQQLIDFIEGITEKDLSHWRDIDNNEFNIYLTNREIDEEFEGYMITDHIEYKDLGNDFLQALWQVAIQIADKEVK